MLIWYRCAVLRIFLSVFFKGHSVTFNENLAQAAAKAPYVECCLKLIG